MLWVGLRLKLGTLDSVREPGAPVIHQQQIMTVHQRAKQCDVAVPRLGGWISGSAFHGNDGFQPLSCGINVRIELKSDFDRLTRCARWIDRANNRTAVCWHALAAAKPERADLDF